MEASFTGLTYERIISYLHIKRQKALQKAFWKMERNLDLDRNKMHHLENSIIMYGIYNVETVEKKCHTILEMHNKNTWNERLFSARCNSWYNMYLSK